MPRPPVTPEIGEFLARPNPAVMATLRPDGNPHTAATWYVWEDGRVHVNMDRSRKRLANLRNDPRVSLTVLGQDDWYHQISLRGRVVAIQDDPEFESADRLSRHYTGKPYPRRDQHRVGVWIAVESWYGWASGRPWTGSD